MLPSIILDTARRTSKRSVYYCFLKCFYLLSMRIFREGSTSIDCKLGAEKMQNYCTFDNVCDECSQYFSLLRMLFTVRRYLQSQYSVGAFQSDTSHSIIFHIFFFRVSISLFARTSFFAVTFSTPTAHARDTTICCIMVHLMFPHLKYAPSLHLCC